jgi:hypothetical protein
MSQVLGTLARVGRERGLKERGLLGAFRGFVRTRVRQLFKPLPVGLDLTAETWLKGVTKYTLRQKANLLKLEHKLLKKKHYQHKSFSKAEFFEGYKYDRSINGMGDVMKVFLSPIFKYIEQAVFHSGQGVHEPLGAFVKGVPVSEWPDYIQQRVHKEGSTYYATDFTSFESSVDEDILKACEWQLYAYMLQNYPVHRAVVHRQLLGKSVMRFKHYIAKRSAVRMSGDPWTSLGNGFTNWMVACFLASINDSRVEGVFEGDDGLFRVDGGWRPTARDYARLGFDIKIETHKELSLAQFCWLVFDSDARQLIKDPLRTLLRLSWTDTPQGLYGGKKRCQELLLAKCLSLAHELPSCPIVSALARRYIDTHADVKPKFIRDGFHPEYGGGPPAFAPIEDGTRRLFASRYQISVRDQIDVERKLQTWDGESLLHFTMLGLCPSYECLSNWNTRVLLVPVRQLQRW